MFGSRSTLGRLLVATGLVMVGCSDGAASVPTSVVEQTAPDSGSSAVPTDPPSASDSTVGRERAAACPDTESVAFGAFDLATGELTWWTCSPAESYRRVLGATADVVIAQESKEAGGADTVGLSAADGTELWRLSTAPGPHPTGDAAGSGVTTVLTDAEGAPFVAGVDVMTGTERWRLEPGSVALASHERVVIVTDAFNGPTSGSGPPPIPAVRGIDRITGGELWSNDLRSFDPSGVSGFDGSAAVIGDVVVISRDSALTALDVASGTVLWSSDPLERPLGAEGVVVGTVRSATSNGDGVRALDAATGDTLWSNRDVAASYGGWLALGDGVLVAHHQRSNTVAIDLRTGEERWRTPLSLRADPQIVAGTSAILLWEGTLGVVDTGDGTVRWSADRPLLSTFMSSVAANDTTVFVSVNSLPWSD